MNEKQIYGHKEIRKVTLQVSVKNAYSQMEIAKPRPSQQSSEMKVLKCIAPDYMPVSCKANSSK